MKRALALIALLLCAASMHAATDTLTITSAAGFRGTLSIPVYLHDTAGTRLGVDRVAGQRIQALGFKVSFSPAGSVTSSSFVRAGALTGKTPLFEKVMPAAGGGVGWVASFAESTNPLSLQSNPGQPGQIIGYLTMTIAPTVPGGTVIVAAFDPAYTALSNQEGTITETFVNGGLTLTDGWITVADGTCPMLNPATVSIDGRAGACAGGTGGMATVSVSGGNGLHAIQWGWRYTPDGPTTPIPGAEGASYLINGSHFGGTGTRWLVAMVRGNCSSVTSSPLQVTISSTPDVTINAGTGVYANSSDNFASVADQGAGATYNWSVTNGTITSGQGTRAIRYSAGASGTVGIDVTVTATGCSGPSSPHADVAIISRPAGASMLYLLTPCRVYDSRNATAIANGQERPITVAGVCGVPAGAKAVTANLTIITPPTDGWMGAFPSDLPWPGTSTINYRANRTRANNAVVPLSGDGRITVKNSGSTLHFIVDVTGYFK